MKHTPRLEVILKELYLSIPSFRMIYCLLSTVLCLLSALWCLLLNYSLPFGAMVKTLGVLEVCNTLVMLTLIPPERPYCYSGVKGGNMPEISLCTLLSCIFRDILTSAITLAIIGRCCWGYLSLHQTALAHIEGSKVQFHFVCRVLYFWKAFAWNY